MRPTPGQKLRKAGPYLEEGILIVTGASGAGSGALPQEVSEKPARAAIRPRMVAIFIVVFFGF